ncbi:MAG TPA: hypothetical protein VKP65_23905 [Rhodothermales bacterium]|nr:hypothetical protein [Rhodothermales bacterium]
MKYWIALCTLFFIILAACDTTPIDEPPSGGEEETPPATCEGDLLLQSTVPDTSHFADESVLTLEFAFEQTASQAITYTVESSDVQVAHAEIANEALRLQPKQIGETNITVTATDACDNTETMAFTFSVLDPCPPSQPADTADYFPLTVGQTWMFEHIFQVHDIPSYREIGTLSWTVAEEQSCRKGTRSYRIVEHFEGKEQVLLAHSDTWEDRESISRDGGFLFVQGDSLSLGPYSFDPFQRYQSAPAPDTLQITQNGNTECASHRPCTLHLTFVRGEGLVKRHFIDHPSVGWYETEDQVRIDN